MKKLFIYAVVSLSAWSTLKAQPKILDQGTLITKYSTWAKGAGYSVPQVGGVCKGLALNFIVNFQNGNKDLLEVSRLLEEMNLEDGKEDSLEVRKILKKNKKKIEKVFQEVFAAQGTPDNKIIPSSVSSALCGIDKKEFENFPSAYQQDILAWNSMPEGFSKGEEKSAYHVGKSEKKTILRCSSFYSNPFESLNDFFNHVKDHKLSFDGRVEEGQNVTDLIDKTSKYVKEYVREIDSAPVFSVLSQMQEYLLEKLEISPFNRLIRLHSKKILKNKDLKEIKITPTLQLAQEIVWDMAQRFDALFVMQHHAVKGQDDFNYFKQELNRALPEPISSPSAVLLGLDPRRVQGDPFKSILEEQENPSEKKVNHAVAIIRTTEHVIFFDPNIGEIETFPSVDKLLKDLKSTYFPMIHPLFGGKLGTPYSITKVNFPAEHLTPQ